MEWKVWQGAGLAEQVACEQRPEGDGEPAHTSSGRTQLISTRKGQCYSPGVRAKDTARRQHCHSRDRRERRVALLGWCGASWDITVRVTHRP